ncbi:MAG: hypothetical protein AB1646_12515 [Thermodesulfobacteriota bacterium]
MPELIRRIRDGNTWAFQVIQHAVAMQAHVPVRIWDMDMAGARLATIKAQEEERNLIGPLRDRTFFQVVPPQVVSRYKDRNSTGWLTRPSNAHPLQAILRRHPKWLAWEHCFMWDWLTKPGSPEPCFSEYFSRYMTAASCPLSLADETNRYLVVGPLFAVREENGDPRPSYFKGMVDEFVKEALNALRDARKDGELELEREFEEDTLGLVGIKKGWLTVDCLRQKTELLANVMRTVFSVDDQIDQRQAVSSSAYSHIAQICFMLLDEQGAYKPQILGPDKGRSLLFSVGIPDHKQVLEARAGQNHEKWRLVLRNEEPPQPKSKIWLSPQPQKDSPEFKYLEEMKILRGELGLSFSVHNDGYMSSGAAELYHWVNAESGMVAEEHGEVEATGSGRDPLAFVARRICNMFTADMVSICYSEFDKDDKNDDPAPPNVLALKAVDFEERLEPETWRARVREETEFLRNIGKVPDVREDNIGYRAVDTRAPQFCRAVVNERGLTRYFPSEQTMHDSLGRRIPNRNSSIAAPLMIHARPFGVLRIDGYAPHQFTLDQMNLAVRLGNVIGPVLFQREMLSKLFKLSQMGWDATTSEKNVYEDMCRTIAEIFLADGAMLWLPSLTQEGFLNLEASFGIRGLHIHKMKPMDENDLAGSYRGTEFAAVDLKKRDEAFFTRYPHRQALRKDGYQWLHRFPVRRQRRHQVLCYLTACYRSQNTDRPPLSHRWNHTAWFVSYYLGALVTAMRSGGLDIMRILHSLQADFLGQLDIVKQGLSLVTNHSNGMLDRIEKLLKRLEDEETERGHS